VSSKQTPRPTAAHCRVASSCPRCTRQVSSMSITRERIVRDRANSAPPLPGLPFTTGFFSSASQRSNRLWAGNAHRFLTLLAYRTGRRSWTHDSWRRFSSEAAVAAWPSTGRRAPTTTATQPQPQAGQSANGQRGAGGGRGFFNTLYLSSRGVTWADRRRPPLPTSSQCASARERVTATAPTALTRPVDFALTVNHWLIGGLWIGFGRLLNLAPITPLTCWNGW